MIKKITYEMLVCMVIVTLTFHKCYSQDDTSKIDDLSLKELLNVNVSTASKTLQQLDQAPATVIVITREQIKLRGYQSLHDLIIDLPDMKLDDKIDPGTGNSLTVRGTQGQQNLIILLDGVKISSPTNEALPIMENYPVNLAEQVEIVYGPASALYGADAVTGIINIISRKIVSGKDVAADATTMAGMYGYTNNTLYLAKKINDDANFVISGQYYYDTQPDYSKVYRNDPFYNISSYKTGTLNTIYGPITPGAPITPQYQAPTSAYNVYAALHIDDFTFSFFTNYTKLPGSYGGNTNNAIYNKDVFIGQGVTTGNAAYKKTLNKIVATTSLAVSEYNVNPQSNYRNLNSRLEPAYIYAASSTISAEEQLDYKVSKKLDITAGASYEKYYVIPISAYLDDPVNVNGSIESSYAGTESYYRPDGLPAQFYNIQYSNFGTYLQSQYALTHKINFTLGARFDNNSRYGNSFNPRLGLVYKASPQTTIKALYGSAFLSPSPSDAYAQYGSFETHDSGKTYYTSFLHLPNPGLQPIRSNSFELSIHQYLTNNFTVAVDGYYTISTGMVTTDDDNGSTNLYHNMFDGVPVGYIEVNVNEGREQTFGGNISFNLKHSIGNLFLSSYASLSYVNGVTDEPGNGNLKTQLDFISPFMFRIGTDVKAGKFTFSPRLLLMGRQNLSSTKDTVGKLIREQTIPGYALLNLSMRYTFGKRVSIFVNITNALNQHYLNVGYNMDLNKKPTELFYGQPEDPIRIMGGINVTF